MAESSEPRLVFEAVLSPRCRSLNVSAEAELWYPHALTFVMHSSCQMLILLEVGSLSSCSLRALLRCNWIDRGQMLGDMARHIL